MHRSVQLAAVLAISIPAVAHAAPKAGSYSGTSKAKYVQVGQATEPTDKGKVSFSVSGSKVSNFRLRGQLVQCGPPAEIPVAVKSITLNKSGKGSGRYTDPSVGTFEVTITVTSKGRASGRIRPVKSLCNADYPVSFSAKRG